MASSRRGSPTHHTEVTGCGAATVGSGAVATTTQPNAPATKAPPTTVPVAVAFGDGTLIVGVGIPPGRYVASNVAGCFWGVGDLSNVTADHLVEVGQAVIDISSSDAAFQSHGCGGWVILGAGTPVTHSSSSRVDATSGLISTYAGTGAVWEGFSDEGGDGGIATNAHLGSPTAVAIDRDGNLFIADAGNNRIRRVGTT